LNKVHLLLILHLLVLLLPLHVVYQHLCSLHPLLLALPHAVTETLGARRKSPRRTDFIVRLPATCKDEGEQRAHDHDAPKRPSFLFLCFNVDQTGALLPDSPAMAHDAG
jgi:hypothetical protein